MSKNVSRKREKKGKIKIPGVFKSIKRLEKFENSFLQKMKGIIEILP